MKVSICLPSYNGAQFITSAIQSILTQSYADFELVISDDDSSDETWQIVSGLADKRLKVCRNSSRLGLVGNWNRCVELAHGEYLVLMHQDDWMHRENIACKVAFLDEHRSVGFVHSNIRRIDESGKVIGGHWLPQFETDRVEPGMECARRLVLTGNFVCCPTVMMRSTYLSQAGRFDSRLPFTVDMGMWLRLASRYDVGYLCKPLLDYRVHDGQETQSFARSGREIIEVGRAIRIALDEYLVGRVPSTLRREARRNLIGWSLRLARWHFRSGRFPQSARYMAAALQVIIGRPGTV